MLKTVKRTSLLAIFGLGLSACAGNVYNDAKMAAPSGDAYSQALFKEMMAIADFERVEEDWTDANYFGGQALTVANGGMIEPTDPNMREMNKYGDSGYTRDDVTAGYTELNGVLAGGGASRDPMAMAQAFAGYECFYEQVEEGHQAADIAACKEQYDNAIAILTAVPDAPGVCYYPINGDQVDFNCQTEISTIADAAAGGGQVGAVGEAEQRVATPDNTAEQENRAVVMRVIQ